MVHKQMPLPFRVVKKRKCVGVQKKTVGVQCGSQPSTHELEERIRTQEEELNRLRWYEFQYHHMKHGKELAEQRLQTLRHEYIDHQNHTGEYRGIFY